MINKFLHPLYVRTQEILLRISMHDFYKFYVCPFMAVLLCEPGKECFKCNPAMRDYSSKFDKWSVTTCYPNRINHEKSSVCQYGRFQLYFLITHIGIHPINFRQSRKPILRSTNRLSYKH